MSIFARWSTGISNRDPEALIACLHEEYSFIRHQSGTQMNRTEMAKMLRAFMTNDAVVVQSQKCLYENEEVMVEHTVMDFADGTREAILSFNRLKNGLIVQTETGATPVTG